MKIAKLSALLYVFLAGLVVFIGYKIYNFFGNSGIPDLSGNANSKTIQKNEVAALLKEDKVKKAMTGEMYDNARRIDAAMNGFGTDEETIFSIFDKLKTAYDVKALFVCHDQIAGTIFWGLFNANLTDRLRAELTVSEFAKIEPKLRLGGFVY